jgi:uncharacterized caspase-like protein
MARFCQGRSGEIAPFRALLLTLLIAVLSGSVARGQGLFEQPVLIVDHGMHTSGIRGAAVDTAGRFAATVSYDKTVRIWSLAEGKLLQTIRVPAGPDDIGKLYAVAMSPDGNLVAAGGWTAGDDSLENIYLFDRSTGRMTMRISGLPEVIHKLVFSRDGRYLAAGLHRDGLRVFDRDKQWAETFRDTDYGNSIYAGSFAVDGRLAIASYDGKIRLYDGDFASVVPPQKAPGGDLPRGLAFSPNDAVLAVVYDDSLSVNLLDGRTLARLPGPNTEGLQSGNFLTVAWSADGQTLFAGGKYRFPDDSGDPVVAWSDAGRGARRTMPAGANTIMALLPLPAGELLVATADPQFEILQPSGDARWMVRRPVAQFNAQEATLAVSADGMIIDFGFDWGGKSPLRFDVRALKLTNVVPADGRTVPPKQVGLPIDRWANLRNPTLDNKPIPLEDFETSRSLAIHPDGDRLVLGAAFSLKAFKATGERLWQRPVPGEAFAVNITGDGRLAVAAYSGGTIRWHRMDDGRELLALMVLADKTNWVAWTPEGFYGATPGAFGVLRWQVNRGFDAAAETVPASSIPRLRRPDALALVLQERETARALGIADMKAARRDVQLATGAAKAPGARLHVLTIGVSDYGDRAKDLSLNFAHRDAEDMASALVNTQSGGLYAEVLPIFLRDRTADKAGIFDALASMQRNMANDAGQSLAVVMFSGHGTMIDGQFYLVPYGVDTGTPSRLKASAIPASEFQGEIAKLAQHGRVLVLLDACRSGGLLTGEANKSLPANALRAAMASSNVTVLTSSSADKLSREDPAWQHGAFTKVMLDALSGSAVDIDTDRNGVISMLQLTAYVEKELSRLTAGQQQLGLDVRFQGDILVPGL